QGLRPPALRFRPLARVLARSPLRARAAARAQVPLSNPPPFLPSRLADDRALFGKGWLEGGEAAPRGRGDPRRGGIRGGSRTGEVAAIHRSRREASESGRSKRGSASGC